MMNIKTFVLALFFQILFLPYGYTQQFLNNYAGGNGSNGTGDYGIATTSNAGQATLAAEGIGNTWANLVLGTNINGTRYLWSFSKRRPDESHNLQIAYYNGTAYSSPIMTIATNGNVGIGTSIPDAKLAVMGMIHAKEVKVDLNVAGPDYVFEPDYKLPSLAELEYFISKNKHLPEVPSAKEMEKNGVNISEMNMLLLKKVEELTLYILQQQKEIDALKELIKK